MKTRIQNNPLTLSKNKSKYTKNIHNAGFILGMALIILSVLLTVSISMTTILIRELKLSSATSASHTAYYLADSAMSCITALNRNAAPYDETLLSTTIYPDSSSWNGSVLGNQTTWATSSITCFQYPLFDAGNIINTPPSDPVNMKNKTLIQNIDGSAGITSPALYQGGGGVKTSIQIENTEFDTYFEKACVNIEIYTKPGTPNLVVTRGSVPCTGEKRVERVLVRKSN
jgi:hypothetical protein